MGLHDQTVGLFVFFVLLNTLAVGLRVYVRTRVHRGAFGWDDVALVVTYIGLLIWVGLSVEAISELGNPEKWAMYDHAKSVVCYIISGTVKISVALVLYRLDPRRCVHIILIVDIIICTIWTIVVTVILGLGCAIHSPQSFSHSVCASTNYAQESSYVIFNVFHLILPVAILWNVQISKALKWGIGALFGVGLLAVIAAIMKLLIYIEIYNSTTKLDSTKMFYRALIWAVVEHGLSLFAASVLALRPVLAYITKTLSDLSLSLVGSNNSSSSRINKTDTVPSSRASTSKRSTMTQEPAWHHSNTELFAIDVRNEVDVRSERKSVITVGKQAGYKVDVYNVDVREGRAFDVERGGYVDARAII